MPSCWSAAAGARSRPSAVRRSSSGRGASGASSRPSGPTCRCCRASPPVRRASGSSGPRAGGCVPALVADLRSQGSRGTAAGQRGGVGTPRGRGRRGRARAGSRHRTGDRPSARWSRRCSSRRLSASYRSASICPPAPVRAGAVRRARPGAAAGRQSAAPRGRGRRRRAGHRARRARRGRGHPAHRRPRRVGRRRLDPARDRDPDRAARTCGSWSRSPVCRHAGSHSCTPATPICRSPTAPFATACASSSQRNRPPSVLSSSEPDPVA